MLDLALLNDKKVIEKDIITIKKEIMSLGTKLTKVLWLIIKKYIPNIFLLKQVNSKLFIFDQESNINEIDSLTMKIYKCEEQQISNKI